MPTAPPYCLNLLERRTFSPEIGLSPDAHARRDLPVTVHRGGSAFPAPAGGCIRAANAGASALGASESGASEQGLARGNRDLDALFSGGVRREREAVSDIQAFDTNAIGHGGAAHPGRDAKPRPRRIQAPARHRGRLARPLGPFSPQTSTTAPPCTHCSQEPATSPGRSFLGPAGRRQSPAAGGEKPKPTSSIDCRRWRRRSVRGGTPRKAAANRGPGGKGGGRTTIVRPRD